MFFPLISDISVRDVVSISRDDTLCHAIDLMFEHNHRDVVVVDEDKYFILTANDVIKYTLNKSSFETPLCDLELSPLRLMDKDTNILETLDLLKDSMEYIGSVDKKGDFFGLLTHTDIISSIDPKILMESLKLTDFIKISKRVKWVFKDHLTHSILNDMTDNVYDSVVIVEDEKPIGIVTTKDAMRIFKERKPVDVPISNYMISPVRTVTESASLQEAINFMQKYSYKRVVVTCENGILLSIVSQKELISLTYSKWANLMKNYQSELKELNSLLEVENKKYEYLASTDSMTQLYNRQKFYELFISEYKTMMQRDNDMSLMMIDIDFFKAINDTYGHNIGDDVIIGVARILKEELRNVDVVCRWGGEEFVALLPTAAIDKCEIIAEKIRLKISQTAFIDDKVVTVSFGLTEVKQDDSVELCVAREDEVLYMSKGSGRKKVTSIL
jgi:diguanylate cyclase